MKNRKKFMSVMLTIVFVIAMSTNVLATNLIHKPNPTPISGTKSMVESILGIVEASALAVAFGMLFYVGIKYTMAAANEKAELKASSIKYIVGAILIFGSAKFMQIVMKLLKDEVGGQLPGMST